MVGGKRLKMTPEDKLWAQNVKDRDCWACVICGSKDRPNAHHLIPREIHATKLDTTNGLTLCPKHHFFSRNISAHNSPLSLTLWLMKNRPEQYAYVLDKIEALDLLNENYSNKDA